MLKSIFTKALELQKALGLQLELPFFNPEVSSPLITDKIQIDKAQPQVPSFPQRLQWPPPYQVKLSARSQRVSLSISPRHGLEVIVPERLRRPPNIKRLLDEKRRWIEKHLSKLTEANQRQATETHNLPASLHLRAISCTLYLKYHSNAQKNIKIKPDPSVHPLDQGYIVSGPVDDLKRVFKALNHFLKQLARDHLTPWIFRLANETRLQYADITIRSQSTLWGSCTRERKISLNNKLLFLPEPLVRYILIHELCHIKHLNHSQRFWRIVEMFDPDYLVHRRAMRDAGQYVPAWLEMR